MDGRIFISRVDVVPPVPKRLVSAQLHWDGYNQT